MSENETWDAIHTIGHKLFQMLQLPSRLINSSILRMSKSTWHVCCELCATKDLYALTPRRTMPYNLVCGPQEKKAQLKNLQGGQYHHRLDMTNLTATLTPYTQRTHCSHVEFINLRVSCIVVEKFVSGFFAGQMRQNFLL